jgi:formylglycine-generating enzyme required for sulfatase activity
MPGKVFVNYRRVDAEAWADRLFERLVQQFPREDVFMDINGHIPVGYPWAQWLDTQVAVCDLMLVLIGRLWAGEFKARHEAGERDYVRVEIESALRRKIPVVPVLLGDTPVPSATELPETIRPVLELQAARLQRTNFDTDAEALAKKVARSIALARTEPVARLVPHGDHIKIDARIIHSVSDGYFQPGAGKSEWFKDIDIGPEMVVVPNGEFYMGSRDYSNERPPHKVAITGPFAVGRYAITFAEWDAAGLTYKPDDQGWGRGKRPVIDVSWKDAKTYASWLSQRTGKTYRLLSEAEWEYCCRAGTTTKYAFGDTITHQQARFSKGIVARGPQTTEVGKFPPNAWGLYDMHGNVWEWCEDNWHEAYDGAPQDGSAWQGLSRGQQPTRHAATRVLRGGSWNTYQQALRSASRCEFRYDRRAAFTGFRIARTL